MSDRVELVVLLDRSGSMQSRKNDHEGGLRSFVEDQKTLAGDVRFTLIQFDSDNPCEVMIDHAPISEVDPNEIHLIPRGNTPLLDAIFKAIAHVERRIAAEPVKSVLFMIITDGEENASRETTRAQVRSRIEELQKKEWNILYLGADINVFAAAGEVGVNEVLTSGFANTPIGTAAVYDDLKLKAWSSRNATGKAVLEYSDEDRQKLMGGSRTSDVAGDE